MQVVIATILLILTASLQQVCAATSPCIVAALYGNTPTAAKCGLVVDEYQPDFKNTSLKIVPITSEADFGTVVDFVLRVFHRNQKNINESDCSEVIGVVGDLDLKTASIIHTLASRANLNITLVSAVAPSTFLPTTNLVLPNLLHMNPLTHYVEALAAFFDHLNWTRIGLISDDTDYYEFAAELVQQKLLENPKRRIVPFVRMSERDNRTKTIQTFKDYNTDVIIVLTNNQVACSLIQEVKNFGLTWPEYAWIFFDISFSSLLASCKEEGIILLSDLSIWMKWSGSYHVSCSHTELETFLNSNVFLTSIQAVASFNSHSFLYGQLEFREGKQLNNISITQIESCRSELEIAFYNVESHQLRVFLDGDKPRGTILKQYFGDHFSLHITLVMLAFFSVFAFVTTVFALYIHFRNEPEIKATSVTVSLSMFFSCYILISYLPLLVIDPSFAFHCHLLVWLSLGGVPLPLITATLLTKILRIYVIFCDPFSYKKKFYTDKFIFLYIMLLVSPSTFILVLWSSCDPHTLKEARSYRQNSVFIYNRCSSNHTINWLGVLFAYYIVVLVVLICFTIKTSKIRYKHFSDAKATNAFAYLSTFVIVLTLIYWYFFRLQELSSSTLFATSAVLYVGHTSIALLCQVLLFVPKVYPPLKRRLSYSKPSGKQNIVFMCIPLLA